MIMLFKGQTQPDFLFAGRLSIVLALLVDAATIYVTGFWKTNQIVTLSLFHFIGPTNGYTRTLHIHSASIRFG